MGLSLQGNKYTAGILLILALAVCFITGRAFSENSEMDFVAPAPGFEKRMLSDYFEGLKNNPMDTPVYVQNGAEPGGSVMVLGGTHPNEPSGYMSAVLMLENARVTKGRLFIVPFGNISGFTNTLPQEASPSRIHSAPGAVSDMVRVILTRQ